MKLNTHAPTICTHEGATAKRINQSLQLRRSVMSCMLWENEFYEDGQSIAGRIAETIPHVYPQEVRNIAIEAREKMKLRHVPLLIAREMARIPSHKELVSETLAAIIQRPDELAEFLAIYWKDGRQPLSAQVKRGLAAAFTKFSPYSLAKYNMDREIRLKDVLFLCHAKPKDKEQGDTWKQLIAGELPVPDTWEVALSGGVDKKVAWTRLLEEEKLGAMALLRNLRNMQQAGVGIGLIRKALTQIKTERVLPFRFLAAARHAPDLEPELEVAMFKCLEGHEKLAGKTCVLVDVSFSMRASVSAKSEITRLDAACGVAMLLREICEDGVTATFSDGLIVVPPRRGFALRDCIIKSQHHGCTELGGAVRALLDQRSFDRLLVITDEQSEDKVPDPQINAYMINVASAKNGVGYGAWKHIDGWSEAVVDYIIASESLTVA